MWPRERNGELKLTKNLCEAKGNCGRLPFTSFSHAKVYPIFEACTDFIKILSTYKCVTLTQTGVISQCHTSTLHTSTFPLTHTHTFSNYTSKLIRRCSSFSGCGNVKLAGRVTQPRWHRIRSSIPLSKVIVVLFISIHIWLMLRLLHSKQNTHTMEAL